MPRKSNITRLPPEIRDLIGNLRGQGRTIDEILAKLNELDVEVSRSSLGRHLKSMAAIAERIRRSREVADSIVRRFGEAPESKTARANIELMHSIIMEVAGAAPEGEEGDEENEGRSVTLDPMQVMLLSKSLDHLGKAERTSIDVIEKASAAAERKARAEAARKLDGAIKEAAAAGEKGLSAERAAQLRRDILGMAG